MRSLVSIQSEIKALIRQKQDREEDLRKHQMRQCSCVGKSKLRCEGMQSAVLSIISRLRAEIYQLRQQELRAITWEKANEDAFQIPGTDDKPLDSECAVSGRDTGD